MNRRKIFIHVGHHKTGTTSIQAHLVTQRRWLKHHGIIYPRTGRSPNYVGAHHNIAWQISGDARFRTAYGDINDLRRELNLHDGGAILSSEDFTMAAINSDRFYDFLRLLSNDGFEVVLLVCLRNQASHAISLYSTFLRMGYKEDFKDYIDQICTNGEIAFRNWIIPYRHDIYLAKLERLPAMLQVLGYDSANKSDSLVRVFYEACGLRLPLLHSLRVRRLHPKPDLTTLLHLFHKNALGNPSLSVQSALRKSRDLTHILYSYTEKEHARFKHCFAESNNTLNSRWNIGLDLDLDYQSPHDSSPLAMSELFSLAFHRILSQVAIENSATSKPSRHQVLRYALAMYREIKPTSLDGVSLVSPETL